MATKPAELLSFYTGVDTNQRLTHLRADSEPLAQVYREI